MNFLKRALLSVKKHKVKNILLAVSFTVIATMLFSSIAVYSAVNSVQEKALTKMGAQVNVVFDKSKKNDTGMYSQSVIPRSALKAMDSLNHVAAYNHYNIIFAIADNFKTYCDISIYKESSNTSDPVIEEKNAV